MISAALSSNTAIDTIMALGASTAGEPAIDAVKDLGQLGKIHVATFDLSAGFLKAVAAGDAAFAIDQQQLHFEPTNYVVFGKPGVGSTTVAKIIAEQQFLVHIDGKVDLQISFETSITLY